MFHYRTNDITDIRVASQTMVGLSLDKAGKDNGSSRGTKYTLQPAHTHTHLRR